jgi:dipeptidyl aminopeptidase/acylaminoacyl peptidase
MKKVTKYLVYILIIAFTFIVGWISKSNEKLNSQIEKIDITNNKILDKYTIENLSNVDIKPGKIEIENVLNEEENFTSYVFSFEFNPNLDGKTYKKTTGQINLPAQAGFPNSDKKFPIIVMLRGYINQETYQTGDGTRRAAEVFAKNGFITIAPDFLGYGGSDEEEANIFETRFQTYTLVLSLLSSVKDIELWNKSDIFLWGHSNGGQIALTILEITEKPYPTVLWAPVSKQFPYSVLYYTDQSEDRGKLIRGELSEFEKDYNSDLYSLDLYLDRIKAPVQIHQGLNDDAVPVSWSDKLADQLSDLPAGQEGLNYYTYPGTDHNMNPVWNTVVSRDLDFYNKFLN